MPMPPECGGTLPDRLSENDVRNQLAHILGSEVFSRSQRLSAFLRFVVEETLAGRGESLKEQFLAAALYGRQFDSASDDSIVRTDARRLRDKLRAFYAESSCDPVIISLPKGTYTPVFERNAAATMRSVIPSPNRPEIAPPARGRLRFWMAGAACILLAASLIAWRVFQTSFPPPLLLPLTQDPGGELEPSLSADGNFVAYAWTGPVSPGAQDIWVKAVDSESRRQLTTTPAPVSENSPAWSPDGKEIAFARVGYAGQSIPNPGVYVMSVLGGPERRVSASGRHPKWTPEGRGLLIRDRLDRSRPAGIFLVDLKTLRSRQITQPASGDGDWKFDLSPDGTTIAFIRFERSGVGDIYTVPFGGGEPQRLTDWSAFISGLAWTPDGREIVFDVAGHSLRRIVARSGAPSKGTQVSNLGGLVTSAALASTPSLSRPARGGPARLAFQLEVINVGLRLVDLEAPPLGDFLQVKQFAEGRRVDIPGPWSPDGERVTFVSYSVGSPAQFRVIRSDGSDLRSIDTITASVMNVGSWAPDGRRIALDAAVSGNSDIYVLSEDGGEIKRLTTEASMDVYPSWSQDGRWIYYSSNRTGRHEVWRMPADGGSPTQITRNGGIQPAESLDGRELFYLDQPGIPESGLASKAKLNMMSLRGIEEKSLVELTPVGRLGLWGVTTRGIFFVTAEPDFEAIHLLRIADGSVGRVGRLPFRLPKQSPRMTFSRDGRLALTNQVDRRESDLMMIDNFR